MAADQRRQAQQRDNASASAAIRSAERMARTEGHIGALVFSRTGDPGSGEFADAIC